jgi:hypothetical protein
MPASIRDYFVYCHLVYNNLTLQQCLFQSLVYYSLIRYLIYVDLLFASNCFCLHVSGKGRREYRQGQSTGSVYMQGQSTAQAATRINGSLRSKFVFAVSF